MSGISAKIEDLSLLLPLLISNAFLPAAYDLSLNIDHQKPNFKGTIKIKLEKNTACTNASENFSFSLHSKNLVFLSANLLVGEGAPVNLSISNLRDAQLAVLSCDSPVNEINGLITVEISYLGSVHKIQTYRDQTYGVFSTNYSDSLEGRSDNYIIATHSQPYGARTIFPCVDEVNVRVPIKLSITTLSKFRAFSNSSMSSQSYIDMTDLAVFNFQETPPMPTSTFGFVIGDLETLEGKAGDVPVSIATTKGDSSLTKYALDCATALLPVLEKLFGVPYPLPKLDIVTLPFFSEGAMENWGMITLIKESLFIVEDACVGFQTRQLLAHQLTHQWIGNLMSFDDFKQMWLTEAFATFVGDYALSLAKIESEDYEKYDFRKSEQVEALMDEDCFYGQPIPSLSEYMAKVNTSNKAKTDSIFEKSSYEKGLVLLNMISTMFQLEFKADSIQPFFDHFANVLTKFKYKSVKPFEMWTLLNEFVTFDLPTFVHSWVQYPGFPCLRVTADGEGIKVTQSRFLYDGDVVTLGLENAPFNVPLAIRAKKEDGQSININVLLSDRSTKLEIKPEQLISFNYNKQFYYKIVYDSTITKHLLSRIETNEMTPLEVIGLINDYGRILGQPFHESEAALFGKSQLTTLTSIINVLACGSWKINFDVLKIALTFLETINNIMIHFSEYSQFKKWIDDVSFKLFEKIGSWDAVTSPESEVYDSTEYECRNVILQLACENPAAQAVGKRLFKNLIHSGVVKKFVPRELFSSMFNVTMHLANMSEYKQILALVKNSNVSYLKHTNGNPQLLQTAAVSSLAFCSQNDLLNKTLHFVDCNIDSKMIELALIGFKFQYDTKKKEILWAWYKVNYDQWVKRSLRKGSDWAKQIHKAVTNITKMVLGEIMQCKKKEVQDFVTLKAKLLPPHGLVEAWEEVEAENEEKRAVAQFYTDMVADL